MQADWIVFATKSDATDIKRYAKTHQFTNRVRF